MTVVLALALTAGGLLALAVVTRRALRQMQRAERAARAAEGRIDEALSHLGEVAAAAADGLARLDAAAVRAEHAVATAEAAVRLADLAITAPAVKARAWGAGGAAAARTFRDRRALRSGSD